MKHQNRLPIIYAVLAAICYGISAPMAKLLLRGLPPALLAALLYLGAGFGMSIVSLLRKKDARAGEARMTRRELPYAAAMVALDIAAPVLLMFGLLSTSPETASLLNNFEIAATSVVALVLFKEAVGRRMWLAIGAITVASAVLSVENLGTLSFSPGAILVLLACVCWGLENNCTSRLSLKNPVQIVIIKGIGSGLGALLIAVFAGGRAAGLAYIFAALALGFASYGLSVYFYILAQRKLGAARTSAFYAIAPFLGAGISLAVFREKPALPFVAAFIVMIFGAYLAASEKHEHPHLHAETEHEHRHSHTDGHHSHKHEPPVAGEHSHAHIHSSLTHTHEHTPDAHHTHTH
ncbi:MAG: EamA family transporter [Oscillospiraceae bacterium]|jgi:drug/metabolite transporter (DMT)-like permease|nr:EamA family transporter [Oscillospiraceae bacterium]